MPDWFIQWAESVNLWQAILLTTAIVGGVWGLIVFVRKGWPWLKSFAHAILNMAQLIDSVKGLPSFIERTDATNREVKAILAAQDTQIAEIHHEVNYNNGSSVKDAVSRVESGVAGLYDEISDLKKADEQLRRDFEDTQES